MVEEDGRVGRGGCIEVKVGEPTYMASPGSEEVAMQSTTMTQKCYVSIANPSNFGSLENC